jgi:hypothetical protein
MVELIKLFSKRLSESTTACALVMTQGSLSVLSLGHWIVALKTGILASFATALVVWAGKGEWVDNKYAMAGLIGLLTAVVDGNIHPASFSQENVVTGIAAGLLCIVMSKVWTTQKS